MRGRGELRSSCKEGEVDLSSSWVGVGGGKRSVVSYHRENISTVSRGHQEDE